jgi:hypothetical protein
VTKCSSQTFTNCISENQSYEIKQTSAWPITYALVNSGGSVLTPSVSLADHEATLTYYFNNFFEYFQYEYDYQWAKSRVIPVTQYFNNTREEVDAIIKGCAELYFVEKDRHYYA